MKKEVRNKEIYRHDIGYEFRIRRRNTRILVVVVILILVGIVIVQDKGGIRTLIQEKIYSFNFSALKPDLILLKGDSMIYPCSFINISSKVNACKDRCELGGMEYSRYKCVGNAVDCYCKK